MRECGVLSDGWSGGMEKLGVSEGWLANVTDNLTHIKRIIVGDGWMDGEWARRGDAVVKE